MPDISRIIFASPDYREAVALRRAVLRMPLGLDFTDEQLQAEDKDIHLGAYDETGLIGTVILTPYGDDVVKLRQMAVDKRARGHGIGTLLLKAAEAEARQHGARCIRLEARLTAEGFYARHGYASNGEVFIQVIQPHILMTKSI